MTAAETSSGPVLVPGEVNYEGPTTERPRYYANDHSRDVLNLEPHVMQIEDARFSDERPTLDREGFTLVPHRSAVKDFRDSGDVAAIHPAEIEKLLLDVTGADRVVVTGSGGVLRFSEKSGEAGTLNNSYPARFIHIDSSDPTAKGFADRSNPEPGRKLRRFCHYNVWRVLSAPPQDVPLAMCDARSLDPEADLIEADAIFDQPGQPEWGFEGYLVRYNPKHRWVYWSNMTRDEAIIFVTNNSDPARPHNVPHSAFNDPTAPPDAAPRMSIEMRACAYWFD